MFIRANFLGVTPLLGPITIIPSVSQYDTFKFYGGNVGSTYSYIWGRNRYISSEEINDYATHLQTQFNKTWGLLKTSSTWGSLKSLYTWSEFYTEPPKLDEYTYLLSKFNYTLEAGNIEGLQRDIKEWLLYRKTNDGDVLEYMTTLKKDNIEYYDFKALNTKSYQYYLFANDSIVLSSPMLSNSIVTDYYGWFLVDVENNRAYQFDVNFSGGDNAFVETINEHKTNNRTNAFTKSSHFYFEGTISSIITKNNLKQDAQYTNEDLLSLADFIVSDRPKIIKTRRGELYNVFTYDYKEELLNPSLAENIYVSSFSFKEVGDN
jgi:hypothetical protein